MRNYTRHQPNEFENKGGRGRGHGPEHGHRHGQGREREYGRRHTGRRGHMPHRHDMESTDNGQHHGQEHFGESSQPRKMQAETLFEAPSQSVCPLCNNRCPASNPACGKGSVYLNNI